MKLAQAPTFPDCYLMSEKVYVDVPFENDVLRVPMWRIYIKDGADYLDVPDTSGPQVPLLAASPFPAYCISEHIECCAIFLPAGSKSVVFMWLFRELFTT